MISAALRLRPGNAAGGITGVQLQLRVDRKFSINRTNRWPDSLMTCPSPGFLGSTKPRPR